MPIEIRELVIKAVVQQDRGSGSAAPPANAGDNGTRPDEELLNKALDKITEILKDRHER